MRSQGDKPQEVLDLHGLCAQVFRAVRDDFSVPDRASLALHDVDHVAGRPPVEAAAHAMHCLQFIRHYATPGQPVQMEYLIGIIVVLVPVLDDLAAHDTEHRGLYDLARDRFYDAAWSLIRDTGGPSAGLFTLR